MVLCPPRDRHSGKISEQIYTLYDCYCLFGPYITPWGYTSRFTISDRFGGGGLIFERGLYTGFYGTKVWAYFQKIKMRDELKGFDNFCQIRVRVRVK